ILVFLNSFQIVWGQDDSKSCFTFDTTTAIWSQISPYFTPPSKYIGRYGEYRSPLIFYNNKDTVKTAADWQRRRKEIKDRWMEMMGEWPPFLKKQHLTIIDSIHRDNFMQYKVQFYWVPEQLTTG